MFRGWHLLILGFALGTVITAGTFLPKKSLALKLPDWTGIGEETITKKSTERKGKEDGPIEKVTFIDEPQSGKTLWDFLELFGTLAVPFLLLYLGNQIQQKDKEIADINLHEEALQDYIDRVSDLLIDNEANSLKSDNPLLELIKDVMRTRTLTILRSLEKDGERKGSVIRFLIDAELISNYSYIVLDLSSANLRGAKLNGVDLNRVVLSDTDLSNADLSNADLNNTNLSNANLSNANLSDADLTSAILTKSILNKANLSNANLTGADLRNAQLTNTNLKDADLTGADLRNAQLTNTNLNDANLSNADLTGADLRNAQLTNTNLKDANLSNAVGLGRQFSKW